MATGGDLSIDASLDQAKETSQDSRTASSSTRGRRDGDQVMSRNAVHVSENNSALNSLRSVQTAQPIAPSDESFLQYLQFFPDSLREDNFDILIINAKKDTEAALGFKKHLETDIIVYVNKKPLCPRVKLLDELTFDSRPYDLDFAFEKTLYVFLYVTKDFCECTWTLLQGQACLTEAIRDPKKQWCVIPVHTRSRKNQNYKLPMMLGSLRPINYWEAKGDQFYTESVRRLIESKLSVLVQRDVTLREERKKYFSENKEDILKLYNNVHSYSSSCVETVLPFVVQESVLDSGFAESLSVQEFENASSQLQNLTISSQKLTDPQKSEASKQCCGTNDCVPLTLSENNNVSSTSASSNSGNVGSESTANSSSGFANNDISVDGSFYNTSCKDNSAQSLDEVTGYKPLQTQQFISNSPVSSSSGFISQDISIDGSINTTSCKNLSPQAASEITRSNSRQMQQSFSNYPQLPVNQHFIVGTNGVTYALTAYGYQPIWSGNNSVNSNFPQSSHASSSTGSQSENTQSSSNFSMGLNMSQHPTIQQMPSLPGSVGGHPLMSASYPYSGFYMSPFSSTFTQPLSLPPYSQGSLPPYQSPFPSFQLPGPWSQLNQSNQQSSPGSNDLKAPSNTPRVGNVEAGDTKSTTESISDTVQHIHHHYHHKKEIRIENATNVVIGDSSKLIAQFGSSEVPQNLNDTTESGSLDAVEQVISNDTIPSSPDERSQLGHSVPSADCHHESSSSQNQPPTDHQGFPECPTPSSIRNPVENSDLERVSNYSNVYEMTNKKTT
ncbi:uncharacterized protein LOC106067820 [Biomphalaria glabrata]|uniref:Uncharacterized protein LOC106067820 n=1 Tax=Biomphalaria glabrata TaxID=6526 RepID=A0A9W3B1Z1_BIOGL|nr:uncharacterized protein LOC106067820 [Biomphalaria glabrata]XP_013082537.2 uncharacterized protein LOC106067820 [Biomphalaria glabrata]XP_055893481.1 uncharacterized protein LOC106067820 [Biomphalaria glabrata]